jgi:hypothetical protein
MFFLTKDIMAGESGRTKNMPLKKKFILVCIVLIWTTSFQYTYANPGNQKKTNPTKKRVSTLWSDKKDCFGKDAFIIAIETFDGAYKVAACAKYGCKIGVREFGKKAHSGNIKQDPKFNWISDVEFETKINGKTKRFYQCINDENFNPSRQEKQ